MSRARRASEPTTQQRVQALTAELDGLYAAVDVDACRENLLDRHVAEPAYDADDSDKLTWLQALREEVRAAYQV